MGSLLELRGENPFKSRAYHNASRVIGGLQDNGNVYCLDPAPWRQLDEGDGQLMMFFPMPFSIGNLLRYSNDGVGVKSAIFSGGEFDQLGVVPVTAGKPSVF